MLLAESTQTYYTLVSKILLGWNQFFDINWWCVYVWHKQDTGFTSYTMGQIKGNLVLSQQNGFTKTLQFVPLAILQVLKRHTWLEATRLNTGLILCMTGKLRILGFLPFVMGCSINPSSNAYELLHYSVRDTLDLFCRLNSEWKIMQNEV